MGQLFGTDGIRGVANTPPMTAETALAIGRATAHICKRHERRHRIVIGKDTRLSGYMLENALTAGICSMGVDVLLVGPLPTPGIAFTTQSMRADAGIVISASHNPFQDNGIKIFSRDGYKLSDELEREIEDLVSSGRINDIRPTASEVGKAYRIDDALGRYIVFCKNTFPQDLSLEGLKIVIDCANGATYKVAPMSNLGLRLAFDELGIRYEEAPVGDRHVLEVMKKRGANLGGEQSGHVIFLDHHRTGDGILTALQVLAILQREGCRVSELARRLKITPQRLINLDVREKPPVNSVASLRRAIEHAEGELGKQGRVLVRYSGTQAICRVMVEGPTEETTNRLAEAIANVVRKELGQRTNRQDKEA